MGTQNQKPLYILLATKKKQIIVNLMMNHLKMMKTLTMLKIAIRKIRKNSSSVLDSVIEKLSTMKIVYELIPLLIRYFDILPLTNLQ